MHLALALASLLTGESSAGPVTLVFGGDVALGRAVRGAIVPIGGGDPLGSARPVLSAADLATVNLETTLWDGDVSGEGIRLVAPARRGRLLADAGIDLVSIANNHALDAGRAGLESTQRALSEVGVVAVGAGDRVVRREVRGTRVAFVAITDRMNAHTPVEDLAAIAYAPPRHLARRAAELIAEASDADVVVVLVHWGRELTPRASPREREAAHAMIHAGADLVIGHGPHVVHEVERYRGGVIFYSLGNLVFDMKQPHTGERVLARVMIEKGRVSRSELLRL